MRRRGGAGPACGAMRRHAPMAYSLVGHSRVSADGGAPVGGSGSALCDAKFDGPLIVTLTTVPVRVFGV